MIVGVDVGVGVEPCELGGVGVGVLEGEEIPSYFSDSSDVSASGKKEQREKREKAELLSQVHVGRFSVVLVGLVIWCGGLSFVIVIC